MTKNRIHIKDLHFEHKIWENELKSFEEEISLFEPHLAEVARKYNNTEVLASVEQLQNQFAIQGENVKKLLSSIDLHEKNLSKFAQNNPIAIDERHFSDHRPLREAIENQRTAYHDLKKAFFNFIDKWM